MPVTRRADPPGAPVAASRPVRRLAVLAVGPLLRLAVVRHAVPAGEPLRVGCDRCGASIGLDSRLRALSPAARCAACAARVGAAPYSIELALLVALALIVAAGLGGGWSGVELVALAWWLGWAVPLTFVDLAVHRLPDGLTYPAAAGTWALLWVAALAQDDAAAWLRAGVAGVGLALLFAATTLLLGRRGFGLGDAKLALSMGVLLGWISWGALVAGLLLAFLLSGLVSLGLLATRRARWSSHVPFGPFLVLGTVASVLLSR